MQGHATPNESAPCTLIRGRRLIQQSVIEGVTSKVSWPRTDTANDEPVIVQPALQTDGSDLAPLHKTTNLWHGNGAGHSQEVDRIASRELDIDLQILASVSDTFRDTLEGTTAYRFSGVSASQFATLWKETFPPPDKTISAHKFLWKSASHFMTLRKECW